MPSRIGRKAGQRAAISGLVRLAQKRLGLRRVVVVLAAAHA
jgi:hypothetical protein